uniref:ZAD domain-containing protein n=1 Tax=Photinus pyralis TaxID=7054 RepID=A0A1Y1KY92_PHOPY
MNDDSNKNFVNLFCDFSFNTVCRLCLEKTQPNKKMSQLFEPKQNNLISDLPGMIMACASIQIIEGDGLPSTICSKCLAKLNVAWQFKLQCENSDAKLRQFYFNNSSQLPIAPVFDGFGFDLKHEQHVCVLKSELDVANSYNNTSELISGGNVRIVQIVHQL